MEMRKDFGQIQVYTGDGKGKTTAALGLALGRVALAPK
jgi:ATP:corrinoid adenosyltransferase